MYIHCDLMVAVGRCVLGRGITEAVLCPELFSYLVVDLGHILILLYFKEAPAGLLGHAFEDLLAVNVALAGIVAPAATTIASTRIAPTAAGVATARISTPGKAAPGIPATAALRIIVLWMGLLALEINGVDDGIGSLGGFDGADEILLAVSVHSVGEDDESLAAGLLAH